MDPTSADTLVQFECNEAVAYLTLNRQDAGNAFDVALARALHKQVMRAADDPLVRCVVLRGQGRMFCVGGDLRAMQASGEALPQLLGDILTYLHPAIAALTEMGKPVITAVHGPAAGAGLGLAAAGDIVLATPDAHFTMAYARIGLSPDGGATWLLPRLIGIRLTQELALTNRRLTAHEAATIGLVTRVIDTADFAQEVAATAATLARSATGAIARTKRLLLASPTTGLRDQLDAELADIVAQAGAAESRAGLEAYFGRREPVF